MKKITLSNEKNIIYYKKQDGDIKIYGYNNDDIIITEYQDYSIENKDNDKIIHVEDGKLVLNDAANKELNIAISSKPQSIELSDYLKDKYGDKKIETDGIGNIALWANIEKYQKRNENGEYLWFYKNPENDNDIIYITTNKNKKPIAGENEIPDGVDIKPVYEDNIKIRYYFESYDYKSDTSVINKIYDIYNNYKNNSDDIIDFPLAIFTEIGPGISNNGFRIYKDTSITSPVSYYKYFIEVKNTRNINPDDLEDRENYNILETIPFTMNPDITELDEDDGEMHNIGLENSILRNSTQIRAKFFKDTYTEFIESLENNLGQTNLNNKDVLFGYDENQNKITNLDTNGQTLLYSIYGIPLLGGCNVKLIYDNENNVITNHFDNNTIIGGTGNDTIYSHNKDIYINPGSGNNIIYLYDYQNESSVINYQNGNDIVYGYTDHDTINIADSEYSTLKSDDDVIISIEDKQITLSKASSKLLNIMGTQKDENLNINKLANIVLFARIEQVKDIRKVDENNIPIWYYYNPDTYEPVYITSESEPVPGTNGIPNDVIINKYLVDGVRINYYFESYDIVGNNLNTFVSKAVKDFTTPKLYTEGYYPLAIFTDNKYGESNKKFRIYKDTSITSPVSYYKYFIEVKENDTILETIPFTMSPDIYTNIDGNIYNIGLESSVFRNSKHIQVRFLKNEYKDFIENVSYSTSIKNLDKKDILFGYDENQNKISNIFINNIEYNFNSDQGIPLIGGFLEDVEEEDEYRIKLINFAL